MTSDNSVGSTNQSILNLSTVVLAVKYMNKTGDGKSPGILLNVLSEAEERRDDMRRELEDSGVKVVTIIRPGVEYHDSEQIHITDDQHSPYNTFNK